MINKILKIQNVGLLQDAVLGGAVDLAQITVIYAENGRGKSTFAAIMRACGSGDGARLNARRTIDSPGSPQVSLLFDNRQPLVLKNGAWSGPRPPIVVFDSEFVDQNVYSGLEVRANHRQSLLEFALGAQAVQAKQRVDQLAKQIDAQTRRRTDALNSLKGYALPLALDQFLVLPVTSDAQQQLDGLRKRLEASKRAQQLVARQDPRPLQRLEFDARKAFDLLGRQLEDVEETAEAAVLAHVDAHRAAGLEDWLSRGLDYLDVDECPFCGQPIGGIELVRAYRSYFNQAYGDLKRDVTALEGRIDAALADSQIVAARDAATANTARIEAWKDLFDLRAPTLPADVLLTSLQRTRSHLLQLVSTKGQAPLSPAGTDADFQSAADTLASINGAVAAYNSQIAALVAAITDHKQKLVAEDSGALQGEITRLEAALRRHLPDVVTAAAEYQSADAERTRLDEEKIRERSQSDALMQATLRKYEASLNNLLAKFGAAFSIERLQPTYVGSGEARAEYQLRLRNRPVKLGSRVGTESEPAFATTLSEGDKRTLAFAFFLAGVVEDPRLSDTIIVVDDPVASLDWNRKRRSIDFLVGLAPKCRQLIVLSHDPYFVREFKGRLAKANPTAASVILELTTVKNDYSAFGTCDVDDVCSSDYYRHHRMVADYAAGKSTAKAQEVAKAIRPLLEGYYHRRFPTMIPQGHTFGTVIELVKAAKAPHPLAFLAPRMQELVELNGYTSQFHHDGDAVEAFTPIVEAELRQYARQALELIYREG